jgi:hypothetical protein
VLHLHDHLVHAASTEAARGPVGKAHEARCNRGAALGRLPVEALGHGHREPVGGQDHGLADARHLAHEAIEQPAEVPGLEAQLVGRLGHHRSSSTESSGTRPACRPVR